MFIPDVIFKSLFEITPKTLSKFNIKAVVLDVDNTLRSRGDKKPIKGVIDWVEQMKKAGIKLAISSNNFSVNISPFANSLNIDFVSMSCKPFPFGIKKAISRFGIDKENVAIIGDQVFTDILGGYFSGITTILVFPYDKEKGPFWRIKRFLEKPFINRYYKKAGGKNVDR